MKNAALTTLRVFALLGLGGGAIAVAILFWADLSTFPLMLAIAVPWLAGGLFAFGLAAFLLGLVVQGVHEAVLDGAQKLRE